MPEAVETFEFRNFGARSGTEYDWDTLLNGKIYKCMEGTDYTVKKLTFLNLARKQAKDRGLKLRTGNIEGGCVIQAQPGNAVTEGTSEVNGTHTEPSTPPTAPPVVKPVASTAKPGGPAPKPSGGGPRPTGKK